MSIPGMALWRRCGILGICITRGCSSAIPGDSGAGPGAGAFIPCPIPREGFYSCLLPQPHVTALSRFAEFPAPLLAPLPAPRHTGPRFALAQHFPGCQEFPGAAARARLEMPLKAPWLFPAGILMGSRCGSPHPTSGVGSNPPSPAGTVPCRAVSLSPCPCSPSRRDDPSPCSSGISPGLAEPPHVPECPWVPHPSRASCGGQPPLHTPAVVQGWSCSSRRFQKVPVVAGVLGCPVVMRELCRGPIPA